MAQAAVDHLALAVWHSVSRAEVWLEQARDNVQQWVWVAGCDLCHAERGTVYGCGPVTCAGSARAGDDPRSSHILGPFMGFAALGLFRKAWTLVGPCHLFLAVRYVVCLISVCNSRAPPVPADGDQDDEFSFLHSLVPCS